MAQPETSKPPGSLRKWLWLAASLFLCGCLIVAGLLAMDRNPEPPFARDLDLARTTYPTGIIPTNAGLWQRLLGAYLEYSLRHRPNPAKWSFPATPVMRSSVHGLLNQCMQVTGAQYFIEKHVAAASVNFGSTNALNGGQWVAAFEKALQTDEPEWWDPAIQGFEHQNLVLLRYHGNVTLVLPRKAVSEYQKRYPGLQAVPAPEK